MPLLGLPDVFLLILLFLTLLAAFIYAYGMRPVRVLRGIGVPVAPGARPFVGHILQVFSATHIGQYDFDCMLKYGKVFGLAQFAAPVLVVTDPVLLKEILLKQFNSFTDRSTIPMRSWMRYSMLDQKGAEWKRIRTLLTPFFSAAKLKHSFPIMLQCSKTFVANLGRVRSSDNMFEAHSLCGAWAMDVICGTAFGIQIDSQSDPNDPFISTMRKLSNLSFASPALFLGFVFPGLSPIMERLGFSLFPPGYLEFFERTSRGLIADRLANPQLDRPDFMQAMLRAHLDHAEYVSKHEHHEAGGDAAPAASNAKKGLSETEIMAQALLFFLAGYDTTMTTLSFLLYNLARYPRIQDSLYREIHSVLGTEEPTYENVQKLPYLDQCLDESLRLFPPAFRFDREAVEDVTMEGLHIPRGTIITVPIWALHYDPDLWPDPHTFDPDRFGAERKSKFSRHEFAHIPFGAGQRGCIGLRFAQLEIKVAVVEILRSYAVLTNERTQIPIELQSSALFTHPKSGIWLSVQPR